VKEGLEVGEKEKDGAKRVGWVRKDEGMCI
jgi:hypothetical protein